VPHTHAQLLYILTLFGGGLPHSAALPYNQGNGHSRGSSRRLGLSLQGLHLRFAGHIRWGLTLPTSHSLDSQRVESGLSCRCTFLRRREAAFAQKRQLAPSYMRKWSAIFKAPLPILRPQNSPKISAGNPNP